MNLQQLSEWAWLRFAVFEARISGAEILCSLLQVLDFARLGVLQRALLGDCRRDSQHQVPRLRMTILQMVMLRSG
jgi:hypothetical protein